MMRNLFKSNAVRVSAVFIIIVFVLFGIWWGGNTRPASAETTVYSDVMDDLREDETFDETAYADNLTDYSLQVITIAESSDNELFVYVYQPTGQTLNLCASSINISTTTDDDLSYFNYKLTLLNSSGVFFKYKVENFTVSLASVRYYVISSILRPYDESIDDEADYGNTYSEIAYEVGKQYCIVTSDGQNYIQILDVETITITDKFVGFVRYEENFVELHFAEEFINSDEFTDGSQLDSHFVAFSTDRDIDRLLEADVYYTSQSYTYINPTAMGLPVSESYGEVQENYAYLTYEDKVEVSGGSGFFHTATYEWDRIETVEQFIEENDVKNDVYTGAILNVSTAYTLTDEALEALEDKQWVLRFVETAYTPSAGSGYTKRVSTIVGDVMILRLKFETDGVTYNLGVVDNKQTGSAEPSNESSTEVTADGWLVNNWEYLLMILGLVILLVIIVLLWPIFSVIFKAIIWVICLPFKAIAALCRSVKKRRQQKSENSDWTEKTVNTKNSGEV